MILQKKKKRGEKTQIHKNSLRNRRLLTKKKKKKKKKKKIVHQANQPNEDLGNRASFYHHEISVLDSSSMPDKNDPILNAA